MSVYCISSCIKPGHVSISISPHYSHFVFPVKISKRHVEQHSRGTSQDRHLTWACVYTRIVTRVKKNLAGLVSSANINPSTKKKVPSCLPRNLPCLVFESNNTFLTYTWLRETGHQHSSSFLQDKHPPVYPAYSTFRRWEFGIVHNIIIYSTISKITVRNRNEWMGFNSHLKESVWSTWIGRIVTCQIWCLQNEWLFLRAYKNSAKIRFYRLLSSFTSGRCHEYHVWFTFVWKTVPLMCPTLLLAYHLVHFGEGTRNMFSNFKWQWIRMRDRYESVSMMCFHVMLCLKCFHLRQDASMYVHRWRYIEHS